MKGVLITAWNQQIAPCRKIDGVCDNTLPDEMAFIRGLLPSVSFIRLYLKLPL